MSSSGKQQTAQLPSLATLKGTSFDVRHLDSVSVILVDQPSLRGLYRLTFANGDAYVGQAINVANRFTSHRRRWEDITQFEFFPIPEGDLNQPEKDLIHLTEANGNVRNIALAHKPLGENSLEIEVSEGATILLPWDRNKRVRPGDSSVSGFRSSFFERSQIPCYSD
ncbi:GIY-YIG nuclease family protein [Corynebacterium urogenitale]|uniref:GIY-YIG nuclease family protein n=1 Tax=Corynebacterium urogenitale TaxID=2487892 RepID=UPI00125FE8FE|nr:GIY-YIG nuclease family protein [Corynebacterium urogenitale]